MKIHILLFAASAFTMLCADTQAAHHSAALAPQVLNAEEKEAMDPQVFAEAVNKLHESGVIDDPQYWIDNAKPGKYVDINMMQNLIMSAAAKFRQPENLDDALAILAEHKVLSNVARWKADLAKPKAAGGGTAAFLIIRLARTI